MVGYYYDGVVVSDVCESVKFRQDKVRYFLSKDKGVSEGEVVDIVNRFIRLTKLFKGKGVMEQLVWSGLGISEGELPFPKELGGYREFRLLKRVVEYLEMVKGVRVLGGEGIDAGGVGSDEGVRVVYSDSDVEVLLALSKRACVDAGRGSRWCISDSHLNFYYRYRFSSGSPTFYVVRVLREGVVEDRYRVVLVAVMRGDDGDLVYEVADKDNNTERLSWVEIVRLLPVLRSLRGVFKVVPYTDKEVEIKTRVYDKISELRRASSGNKVSVETFERVFPIEEFVKLGSDEIDVFLDMYMGEWFVGIPDAHYFALSFYSKKRYISLLGDISSYRKVQDVFSNQELLKSKRYHLCKHVVSTELVKEYLGAVSDRVYEPYFRGVYVRDFFTNEIIDKVSRVVRGVFDGLLIAYAYEYEYEADLFREVLRGCEGMSWDNVEKVLRAIREAGKSDLVMGIVETEFSRLSDRVSRILG